MCIGEQLALIIIILIAGIWVQNRQLAGTSPDDSNRTLLLLVRDSEAETEFLLYELMRAARRRNHAEVIVVDCGSSDLTRAILSRLQARYGYTLLAAQFTAAEGIAAGVMNAGTGAIHIFDTVQRMSPAEARYCLTAGVF